MVKKTQILTLVTYYFTKIKCQKLTSHSSSDIRSCCNEILEGMCIFPRDAIRTKSTLGKNWIKVVFHSLKYKIVLYFLTQNAFNDNLRNNT